MIVAFGFSWAVGELYFRWLPHFAVAYALMAVLYMYGPALAALCAQRFGEHAPLRALGPLWRGSRYLWLALFLPSLLSVAAVLVSAMFPDIALNLSATELMAQVQQLVPPEKQAELVAKLSALGSALPWLGILAVVCSSALAGASVNALVALGEELGWRGFLQRRWAHWGFWRSSLAVGTIWGLWHLPVILRGHNYPQHPVAGVFMMILFCMLIAPLFYWIMLKAKTLLAAVFLHGAMNASGGLVLYLRGANDLLNGMTGLGGLLVLMALNGLLAWQLSRSVSEVRVQKTEAGHDSGHENA